MITTMDMIMFGITPMTMTMPTTNGVVAGHTRKTRNTRKTEAKG